MPPVAKMMIGIAATVGSAWIFHGPAGYGQRLIDGLNAQVQPIIRKQELPTVTASFPDPLSRDLRFSGQANDFQRGRFVEIIQEANIRGLRTVGWTGGGGGWMTPLFLEGLIWQLGAYALGLAAAFGVFGRRATNYR